MTTYTPRHEDITGSSLSGAEGTNRTYTLVNSNAVLAQMQVILAENVLQNSVNFTFDADNGIITFLSAVFNDQNISIDYFTTDTVSPVLVDNYCTTLGMTRAAGIGFEVFTENLGTGDGSTTSFDLKNGNVIDNSYTVKYAAADSNSFNNMIEDTHYTILKDQGLIELTSAGKTLLSTNVLYIDYTYSPRQSDTVLSTYLSAATAEVDKITGNYWGSPKTSVQHFDGYTSGYPQTDKPYGVQIEPYPEFDMRYKGLNSITSVIFLDRKGETDRTLDSDEYRIFTEDDTQESRLLINTVVPNGKANVKVTFIHGYDTVPSLVQELACYVGGLMALVNISGGSYKDVSTYTLGRKTFSIGQVYVNIRESIDQMKSRIDMITNQLGGNFASV